jgi:hypothetical protein
MTIVARDEFGAPLENFPWTYSAGQVTTLDVSILNEGPGDLSPVLVALQTESPTQPGVWESYTTPPQEEQWLEAQVTGSDNTNVVTVAGWVADLTDFKPMGAGGGLLIPLVPALGEVFITIRARPPAWTQATGSYNHKLAALFSENSLGVSAATSRGIISGVGRGEWYSFIDGGDVTTFGDETVAQAEVLTVLGGLHRVGLDHVETFDQDDGDAVTLAVGEAYHGRLVWEDDGAGAASPLAIKGPKSASGIPDPPPVPAGAVLGFGVKVEYQGGGLSIIDDGDIIERPQLDRFGLQVDPSNPLALLVGPGQDIGPGVWRFRVTPESIVVGPSITDTRLWLTAGGGLEVADTPPSSAARLLADQVTSDGVSITGWRDRRTYAHGELRCWHLMADMEPALVGEEVAFVIPAQDVHVQSIRAELYRDSPNAGSTDLDIEVDGATVWPTGGSPLVWPDDAPLPTVEVARPELAEIAGGSRIGVRLVSLSVGGAPERINVCIVGFSPG